MQGWIKLHRTIMKSDTFSRLTAIQQLIAIYIILNANHEDGIWYDKYKDIEVPVKRGQLVVSRNKITNEWFKHDKEVTEQKVRTTLKKLEKLNFLTITSTNNYTLLEVHNYCTYQAKVNETNQVSNQETTKGQPRENQEKTTNKNDKNVKEEIYTIFNHWNSKKIIVHKKMNDKMQSHINARLEDYSLDELLKAIDNFDEVLTSDKYYWTHRWTLEEFMGPNKVIRFMDGSKPLENFLAKSPSKGNYQEPTRSEPKMFDLQKALGNGE